MGYDPGIALQDFTISFFYFAFFLFSFFRGLFDQFEGVDIDTKIAATMVASEQVKRGMFEDAITLYNLAGVSVFIFRERNTPKLRYEL